MGWAQLDDQFPTHPKVLSILAQPDGLAAIGLWAVTLAWAHAYSKRPADQQGILPRGVVMHWRPVPEYLRGPNDDSLEQLEALVTVLVVAGMWDELPDGSGWRIHDFRDWQQLEARDRMVDAGKRGAAKRWGTPLPLDGVDAPPNGVATGVATGGSIGGGMPHHPPPTTHHQDQDQDQNRRAPVPGFDEFWATYPRKTAKAAARRKWDQVVKTTDQGMIVAAAARFAELWEQRLAAGKEPKFIPHPATWLNGGRWDDEEEDAEAIRPQWDA